jgi:hypothetical protein
MTHDRRRAEPHENSSANKQYNSGNSTGKQKSGNHTDDPQSTKMGRALRPPHRCGIPT